MNLAIVGHGKMGRLIEHLAPEYGFDVKLRLDIGNNEKFEGLTKENFRGIDVALGDLPGPVHQIGAFLRPIGRADIDMRSRRLQRVKER